MAAKALSAPDERLAPQGALTTRTFVCNEVAVPIGMPVSDIARERVVTVDQDESLESVATAMRTNEVGCVVVTDDDEPIALLSDRELAMAVLDERVDPETATAGSIDAGPLTTVGADDGIYELLDRMSEHGVRRVPVVDDGELVGIVSLSDVVVLLGMELQQVANTIRADSPAYERSPSSLYD